MTRRQTLATSNRTNSLFLRLPLELRHEIYALVLSGYHIHLTYPPQRKSLCHVKGKETADLMVLKRKKKFHQIAQYMRSKNVDIALLQTCRQIYTEAAKTLYTENVFSVSYWPWAAALKPISAGPVPRQYLCHIRRLEIDWFFKHRLPTQADMLKEAGKRSKNVTWTTLWKAIANEMPMLRILYVRIEIWMDDFSEPAHHEMHWAEPMLQIGALQSCKVFIRGEYYSPYHLIQDLSDSICTPSPSRAVPAIQKPLESYPETEDAWMLAWWGDGNPHTYTMRSWGTIRRSSSELGDCYGF